MGDWYTVRISPTYTSGLLDTKDIGNEEWWGQFVGKAFEYLWISFKMHHPFDCYYSRRKFCDVLCTHPAWANAWFEAMRFLMAAYQKNYHFAQEVDDAAYRTHMQFVAYSQKASGEMKAIASRALDAAGDKMQEADFLKRVKDAKEEWLKEVRKIKVDANMVTPQIQRSRRMSFGTPFFSLRSKSPNRPKAPIRSKSPNELWNSVLLRPFYQHLPDPRHRRGLLASKMMHSICSAIPASEPPSS